MSSAFHLSDGGKAPIRALFVDHTAMLGGGEIALFNLIRHLDRRTVEPIVVLGAEGPLAEKLRPLAPTFVLALSKGIAGTKKDTLGLSTLLRIGDVIGVLAYVGQLVRFIRQHRIDLIHTNSLKADILGGMAGRLARRPVIWHVRDRIEDDYLPRLVVRAFRTLARILPTYLVANSGATLRTLHLGKGQHGTSIPSGIELGNRTSVVHDGINPSLLHGESGHDDGICRIGLIGRISPWKGQHIFIRAAALVHEKYPKARFVMIGAALFGEERYEGEVRRLPAALGIESVVEFAGFRADVQGAIAQLDLVVHASTTGEPFGQVIIEGMASGKPVIATNGGGVPEIIEDGVTGLLVPMGDVPQMADAICRILANPAFGREMGARARRRVAHDFTVEKTARKVEAVYAEVLGRSLAEACPSPLVA